MFGIDFSEDDGKVRVRVPKKRSKRQMDRLNRLSKTSKTKRGGEADPLISVVLAMAAANGPKTFDRVAQYLNVA